MRQPKLRRRWFAVVAIVLAVTVVAVRSLDTSLWIYYYRVVDEHTLIVGTTAGPGAWTRVTSVTETPSTITITVSSLEMRLGPRTAVGVSVESIAKLHNPIGSRTVIDGSNASPVQRTNCLPPVVFAPGCTP